jgi:hypothetical protein
MSSDENSIILLVLFFTISMSFNFTRDYNLIILKSVRVFLSCKIQKGKFDYDKIKKDIFN